MITWLLGTVSAWNTVCFFFEKKKTQSLTWWNYFKTTNTHTDSTRQKQPRPHRFPCWISPKFVCNGINIGFTISFKTCMDNTHVNKAKGTQETPATAHRWAGKPCRSPGVTRRALRFWGAWRGSRGGTALGSITSEQSWLRCLLSQQQNREPMLPKAQTTNRRFLHHR